MIAPAAPDSGYCVRRRLDDGRMVGPVRLEADRVSRTTLCTTVALGDGVSVATVEHVLSALSGLGVDNALLTVTGGEFPILDGSAAPFVSAILAGGLDIQPASRRYLKILRQVTVRNNDCFAALEPYNGRLLDIEIDFDSKAIGRQRMILDWTPRRYAEEVADARTFGFLGDARVLRQAGYALGSSMDNAILIGPGPGETEDRVLNPGGLRHVDEFVRHKLLDAVGDLALCGLPIYGRFRSYKGGHALNALVLHSLFGSDANYEIVYAEQLPLAFDALDDMPRGMVERSYLRSVG
jgi:UDP-3-O-[3-hydroxymyristoyl] N-acetylglucosamine deacetylase